MKKSLILLMSALLLSAPVMLTKAAPQPTKISYGSHDEFMKSTDGTWAGMKNMWYKLDKGAKLWVSMDGKKWMNDKQQMWQDKDGKWLKIQNKKLVWSADGGKTWAEVPDWSWQGPNGDWYKFDKSWSLWVKKA